LEIELCCWNSPLEWVTLAKYSVHPSQNNPETIDITAYESCTHTCTQNIR